MKSMLLAAAVVLLFSMDALAKGGEENPVSLIVENAALTTVEPYLEEGVCLAIGPAGGFCLFEVPAGKILRIEKVSGFSGMGVAEIVQVQFQSSAEPGSKRLNLIPRAHREFFEADNGGYATDANAFPDGTSDIRVEVRADGSLGGSLLTCYISGRLFDAPEE